ncbi:ribonuclease kappa [Helicoverpa armigera]|uniref:ribonuclease kappa n=2 Tax=Helicoverpa TaxID=7112 RepID=UPI000DAB2C20|nr:hypothetical protein B5X24_HaOG208647 [Helicoverpa armigera]
MGYLLGCGICCSLISVWGIIQLTLMGIFYYVEAVTLLEDVEAEEYDDYEDYIHKTEHNYAAVARNCWIAAAIYLVFLALSYTCIIKARSRKKKEDLKLQDDDYVCAPKPPPKKKERKEKARK